MYNEMFITLRSLDVSWAFCFCAAMTNNGFVFVCVLMIEKLSHLPASSGRARK